MSRNRVRLERKVNVGFVCLNCGRGVAPTGCGVLHRNHCPRCLYSLHVDLQTGDRRSGCRGAMVPIGIWVHDNGEWSILHRCRRCGSIRSNRIAGDDNEAVLLGIAAKPLSSLPFPVDLLLDSQLVPGNNRRAPVQR